MANSNYEPRFGEKAVDSFDGYNLSVEWGDRYESAREAALDAIKKYSLSEEDFWISKVLSWGRDKIIYKNIILSYAGCLKINAKLDAKKKFDPACIEQGYGPDGGVLFVYRSKEQGVFVTGEASRFNLGNCPYPGSTAERRVFCRFINRITGLYAEGVYTEPESEEFATPEKPPVVQVSEPVPEAMPAAPFLQDEVPAPEMQSAFPEPAALTVEPSPSNPETCFIPNTDKARLRNIMQDIVETKSNFDALLAFYKVSSLDEMTENQLSQLENQLYIKKMAKAEREAKLAKAEEALANEPAMAPVQTAPQPKAAEEAPQGGISPIAARIVGNANVQQPIEEPAPQEPTPMPEAPAEETLLPPIGETVYQCIADSPNNFLGLNGKTFDEIGKELLKSLYGRANARGRKYVTPEMLDLIEKYLAA